MYSKSGQSVKHKFLYSTIQTLLDKYNKNHDVIKSVHFNTRPEN